MKQIVEAMNTISFEFEGIFLRMIEMEIESESDGTLSYSETFHATIVFSAITFSISIHNLFFNDPYSLWLLRIFMNKRFGKKLTDI